MRTTIQALLTTLAMLVLPATASANFAHTVMPGESLSSVAAVDGLSVAALAAANGLSTNSQLITGSTLQIPPQSSAAQAAPDESTAAPASSVSSSSSGGYVVQPGDTLSAIAAVDGTTVDQLAAENGLDPNGLLPAGAHLSISGASSAGGSVSSAVTSGASGGYVVQPGDTLSAIAAVDGTTVDQLAAENGLDPNGLLPAGAHLSISGSPAAGGSVSSAVTSGASGGYVVQPGDTLSAIAAVDGTTVDQLAAENGLDPNGLLPAGAHLGIPGATVTSSEPVAASGGAQPTAETVSPADVGQVAADNGVSSSLAEAIAQQESGFNNDEVSSTGAVGVMQIEPGTWTFIGQNLAPTPPLSPTSAQDNVRGGVLLLRSLLDQTGGDPGLAAAGYYQGLASVREHGLFSSTKRYVANVLALQNRFGGP